MTWGGVWKELLLLDEVSAQTSLRNAGLEAFAGFPYKVIFFFFNCIKFWLFSSLLSQIVQFSNWKYWSFFSCLWCLQQFFFFPVLVYLCFLLLFTAFIYYHLQFSSISLKHAEFYWVCKLTLAFLIYLLACCSSPCAFLTF